MYKEDVKEFLKSVARTGIRMRQRRVKRFDKGTLKVMALSLDGGVLAVTGCLQKEKSRKIQTLIFNRNKNSYNIKAWNLRKAKKWLSKYKKSIIKTVNPERIVNKVIIAKSIRAMEKALIEKLPKAINKVLGGEK